MNKRERILAAVVVTLLVAFGAQWLLGDYQDLLLSRRTAVTEARQRLIDARIAVTKGQQALEKMERAQERSLPNNRERALSLYRAWLLEKANHAGLVVEDIKPSPRVASSPAYTAVGYQMEASGSLSALAGMLYEFYRSPLLHQITNLRLSRSPGQSDIDISLAVEALAVPKALATDSLPEGESDRLRLANLEQYQKSLSERDFASAYSPPRPPAPPREERRAAAPPQFDDAEHAYFSGAVGSAGSLRAWINVRTTGETLRVAAGDSISVGTLEGKIVAIEPRALILKSGEKKYRVTLGQTLRAGKELAADGAQESRDAATPTPAEPSA